MYGVRKSDYLEPDAVHKRELSNVSDAGVRDVHRGEQLATVTGVGTKRGEVSGHLKLLFLFL